MQIISEKIIGICILCKTLLSVFTIKNFFALQPSSFKLRFGWLYKTRVTRISIIRLWQKSFFFKWSYSRQGWTATMKHGVTRKRSTQSPCISVNQCLRHNLGYKQKIIQFIWRNQVYFSSSNVSTDTTVIVKDYMLSEKFTFCFKITIKWNLTKSHATRLK